MSLLTYILLLVIFTVIDLITSPFWMLISAFAVAMPIAAAGVPDSIAMIITFIIMPVIMSSIPIVIVIAVNRRKYMYNEISRKECIVSDLVFSLIKIAVSLVILMMIFGA